MVIVNVLIVAGLILVNGLLALSEMAIVSSRSARLRQMVEEGMRGSSAALRLVEAPARLLSTVQVGITLIGIIAGAVGGATLSAPLAHGLAQLGLSGDFAYQLAFGIVVALTTYFSLIIGELVPKHIALRQPERMASRVAKPMLLLSRLAGPMVWLLNRSTNAVLLLFGIRGAGGGHRVTEGEVRSMIQEGTTDGVFDPREQAMIDGVLRLDDRAVRSVMVPQTDVVWLDIDDDLKAVQDKIAHTGFSRFLVCRGEIDEIVGFVRTRDILDVLMQGEAFNLADCVVPAMVVLDSLPVISLLDQFKTARTHLAVVVDEYGSTVGIATMTDVVEVVAGDLPEHWEDGSAEVVQRDDGSWLVDGMTDIEDFENALGIKGVGGGKRYHTVAGFVLHCLEAVPAVGDHVQWQDIRFEVVDMDGYRIDKVLVTLPGSDPEQQSAHTDGS